LYFDTQNRSFTDIKRYLAEVTLLSGSSSKDEIRSLKNKLYASAIRNMLYNDRELTYDEQLWIASRLAEYIQTGIHLPSADYQEIIMSDILEKRLQSVTQKNRYGLIIEYKDHIKRQIPRDVYEPLIAKLKLMIDTVKTNNNDENKVLLNKFMSNNIFRIFNRLPTDKQIEIEKLIDSVNQTKSGGYSVGSRRKQPTRRLRKTQYRRKKNTRKSKKPKQV